MYRVNHELWPVEIILLLVVRSTMFLSGTTWVQTVPYLIKHFLIYLIIFYLFFISLLVTIRQQYLTCTVTIVNLIYN